MDPARESYAASDDSYTEVPSAPPLPPGHLPGTAGPLQSAASARSQVLEHGPTVHVTASAASRADAGVVVDVEVAGAAPKKAQPDDRDQGVGPCR